MPVICESTIRSSEPGFHRMGFKHPVMPSITMVHLRNQYHGHNQDHTKKKNRTNIGKSEHLELGVGGSIP